VGANNRSRAAYYVLIREGIPTSGETTITQGFIYSDDTTGGQTSYDTVNQTQNSLSVVTVTVNTSGNSWEFPFRSPGSFPFFPLP